MTEIEWIYARAHYERRLRATSSPRACFVLNPDYTEMYCERSIAERNAKQRLCLDCYYWSESGCWKPFGLRGQLRAIVARILWRLRWKWNLPLLDWCYCYKFRLDRRKEEK